MERIVPCVLQRSVLQLLSQRKWWIDAKEYDQAMQEKFSYRQEHCMPLEKAKVLFALRDKVCDRVVDEMGVNDGNVFVVQSVFGMPKSPAIFILRAMKLKNKAVLQGFPLKGEIKKGDIIKLNMGGTICSFTALDVISSGTRPFEKSTFYDELATNIHNHKVTEKDSGWIIISTEEYQNISEGDFAVSCKE